MENKIKKELENEILKLRIIKEKLKIISKEINYIIKNDFKINGYDKNGEKRL